MRANDKTLLVSTGTNDATTATGGATEAEYVRIAKRLLGEAIGHGMHHNALVRVTDTHHNILFECRWSGYA